MISIATIYWQFLGDISNANKYYDLAYEQDSTNVNLLQNNSNWKR
jgi:hypothetical protein